MTAVGTICCEEAWICDELWRMRIKLSREEFTRTVVLLLHAAQRDGRGALRPRAHRTPKEGK